MEDGTELPISFENKYLTSLEERIQRAKSAAGGWKGLVDGDKLKQEIYEARRAGSRQEPDN